MLLLLFSVFTLSEDRRIDPFQFNLCVWDLEGLDPPYTLNSVEDTRDKEENDIAQIMYSSLSTCDMFVLPGLRNHDTAQNLVKHMDDHSFKDFIPYPLEGRYDSTILSRIDLTNTSDIHPNEFPYPIENSKCNFTGPGGYAMMNMSFYGTLNFHDPVPTTHVFSLRLKSEGNTPEMSCAIREAQAQHLCDITSKFDPKDHIYLAGSFEANPSDPYHSVLENCGFIDTWYLAPKHSYSRKNATDGSTYKYDTIWVNKPIKEDKYLDVMTVITDKNNELLSHLNISTTLKTMPFTLYNHQPLTKKWKTFEIAFSSCMVPVSVGFFVFLLIYSTEKKPTYQTIED